MTNNIHLSAPASCSECGFSTTDIHLLANHSCDVQTNGGRCEDFPCCGHEPGDCNGLLYGSDEAIKAHAMEHVNCDHENGVYECEDEEEEPEYDDDEGQWEVEAYNREREEEALGRPLFPNEY